MALMKIISLRVCHRLLYCIKVIDSRHSHFLTADVSKVPHGLYSLPCSQLLPDEVKNLLNLLAFVLNSEHQDQLLGNFQVASEASASQQLPCKCFWPKNVWSGTLISLAIQIGLPCPHSIWGPFLRHADQGLSTIAVIFIISKNMLKSLRNSASCRACHDHVMRICRSVSRKVQWQNQGKDQTVPIHCKSLEQLKVSNNVYVEFYLEHVILRPHRGPHVATCWLSFWHWQSCHELRARDNNNDNKFQYEIH